jgi:hypothetical protein
MTIEAERAFEASRAKKKTKGARGGVGVGGVGSAASSLSPPSPPTAPAPFSPPSRDPSRGWSPPWSRAAAALGHAQWGNDVVLRYLSSGVFEWDPLGGSLPPALLRAARALLGDERVSRLPRVEEAERPPLDWFGLNFYGRVVLDWRLCPTCYPGELLSDFGQGVWPAGLKAAVRRAGRELRVPVFVTETGVPDGADAIRAEWADSYLGALEEVLLEEEAAEAEAEGRGGGSGSRSGSEQAAGAAAVDLRGVCYWSLVDSFEWAFGYSWFTKFGLFAWDHREGPDGARTRRPSAEKIAGWFGRLAGVAERSWRRRGLECEASFPAAAAAKQARLAGGKRRRGARGSSSAAAVVAAAAATAGQRRR